MSIRNITVLLSLFVLLTSPLFADGVSVTRIATGLHNPRGIAVMPDGRLIVIEAGTGYESIDPSTDSGKLSILEDINQDGDFDDAGEITRIFSHIPSYNAFTRFGTLRDEVGGPGDVVLLNDGSIFFTYDDPFELVTIVEVSSEGRNVGNLIMRDATMNGLFYDANADLFYVVESGWNRLIAVDRNREVRIVTEFDALAHNQQAVPAGLAQDPLTGDFLVALFSGQVIDYYQTVLAFMPGDSKIVRVDPASGETEDEIVGLTTAVDVAADEHGNLYVVELTRAWPTTPLPHKFDLYDPESPPDPGGYARFTGRVTMYSADGSPPMLLAGQLDAPTNITYHDGALYVSVGQGTPERPVIGPDGVAHISGEIYKITGFQH